MMPEKAYTLKDLRYRPPGSRFELELDNLELEVGKIVALVGPNGAGKTTLLHLLGLLQKPQGGTLEFFGKNPWNGKEQVFEQRRQVTLVTHNPYLFHGSVFDNLVFGLKVRGVPESAWKNQAEEVLDMVELAGFEEKPAAGLSAGQAQRVALARAIMVRPRVLLLDEPTANIDATMISRIEAMIAEVNRNLSATVVFSTHNFSQAFRLADQVIYLSDGRRVEYSHENYFSGKAESDGNSSWIEPRPGSKIVFPGKFSGHVTCLISPEKIEVLSGREADPKIPNQFSGRVTRLEMTGNNLALVRVSGDLNFRVNLTMQELENKRISLSSSVLLRFSPEAVEVVR